MKMAVEVIDIIFVFIINIPGRMLNDDQILSNMLRSITALVLSVH